MGVSDHNLIYYIRKIYTLSRSNTKAQGHNFLQFKNFKKFIVAGFLEDLYDVHVPWENIRYKRNIDDMWGLWKTYFLEVLDKHASRRVKRLRNKANIPWVNGDERQNYPKEML